MLKFLSFMSRLDVWKPLFDTYKSGDYRYDSRRRKHDIGKLFVTFHKKLYYLFLKLLDNHPKLLDNHPKSLDNHPKLLDNHLKLLDNHP